MLHDKVVETIDGYLGVGKKPQPAQKETYLPAQTKKPPLTANPIPTQSKKVEFAYKPYGLSEEAKRFIADVIEPHKMTFHTSHYLPLAYDIVELLDMDGLCPSVVQTAKKRDSEAGLVPSVGKVLARINMRDHSFRVARCIVELHRAEYTAAQYWDVMVPYLVVAALSHDIGKIPEYRDDHEQRYAVADHPLVSVGVLEGLCAMQGIKLEESVKTAILSHHRAGKDQDFVGDYLKRADALARDAELKMLLEDAYRRWDDWFVLKDFIAHIAPEINIMTKGNICPIFTYKGFLYATPDFLFKEAQKFAGTRGVFDPILTGIQDKAAALKRIVETLKHQGMITDLPPGYYGLPYIIDTGRFSFQLFLTPIKIEILPELPSFYENRKVGWVKIIRSVRRLSTQK